MPSPPPVSRQIDSSAGVPGSSPQSLGLVVAPGRLQLPWHAPGVQAPPGHCEASVQVAPLFVPPTQFLPGHCAFPLQELPLFVPPMQAPQELGQVPPGHCEATVQFAPWFVPPMHWRQTRLIKHKILIGRFPELLQRHRNARFAAKVRLLFHMRDVGDED